MFQRRFVFALVFLLLPPLAGWSVGQQTVLLNKDHVGATNPGFQVGECPTPPEGQEGWWGWHFIMPQNNNFTSLTVTFENAGTFSVDEFPGTVFVAHPDSSHAYIWTPTPDKLLSGFATSDGDNAFFNLSHVCPGTADYEELTVSKTAETSYSREHFWSIEKSVETENGYTHDGTPKIWLYIDGTGNESATWTVDASYEGFQDFNFQVSGEITVENTGTLNATITGVSDVMAGMPWTIDSEVTFPYVLEVGDSLTLTYSSDVDNQVDGLNVATVQTERNLDGYVGTAELIWSEQPTNQINETVTIRDMSDLFGDVLLGTVTAPDSFQFTYDKDFAWTDYGKDHCGDYVYENIAYVEETDQWASAVLKVNVQCYVYETAYAKGLSAECFIPTFSRWGWTNLVNRGYSGTWPLWAGAAQCDTSKGTLVGDVYVEFSSSGHVTVNYLVNEPFLLEETHVYAGTSKFPKDSRGRPTVAPGQYMNFSPFASSVQKVYVIAHAVVGIPDPNFGPQE